MIPKKLFSPKCLHPDREVVFNDDLQRFFNYILDKKKIVSNNEMIISYSEYKIYYKEKKISMLHFSRSKEENAKEYYECLFGQVQNFFFYERL
jgi:isochorismate hydrolase